MKHFLLMAVVLILSEASLAGARIQNSSNAQAWTNMLGRYAAYDANGQRGCSVRIWGQHFVINDVELKYEMVKSDYLLSPSDLEKSKEQAFGSLVVRAVGVNSPRSSGELYIPVQKKGAPLVISRFYLVDGSVGNSTELPRIDFNAAIELWFQGFHRSKGRSYKTTRDTVAQKSELAAQALRVQDGNSLKSASAEYTSVNSLNQRVESSGLSVDSHNPSIGNYQIGVYNCSFRR